VSISRARERARLYTDDAELLGRRIEDTHTRKAAVELEGLREALRRAGYVRKQAATVTETERPDSRREKVEQTIGRVVRQMRQLRVERLAPVQRLTVTWAQALREWLGERLGVERTVTPRQSAREFIAQAQREAQQQTQRQSRGIRM
jgi:hypothetical protein